MKELYELLMTLSHDQRTALLEHAESEPYKPYEPDEMTLARLNRETKAAVARATRGVSRARLAAVYAQLIDEQRRETIKLA